MTISGSTVYRNISSKVDEVEFQQNGLSRQVSDVEDKISSLGGAREDCFTKLALIYLPQMDAESVAGTLKEVQAEVSKIFKDKQNRRKELEAGMALAVQERKSLEEKLSQVSARLDDKAKERDKLNKTIAGILKENTDYTGLIEKAKVLGPQLQANNKRFEELETELQEKAPAYLKNKLFSYLMGRNFDPAAPISGLTGRLDAIVSSVINYPAQKRNYDALVLRPQIVAEEIVKRKNIYNALVQKITAIEKEQADAVGLTKVMQEGALIDKEKKKISSAIETQDTTYAAYATERKSLDNLKDGYHKDAIQKLKAYLKGDTIADLKKKASATPSIEDDKLIKKIEDIDDAVRQLKDSAKELKLNRDSLTEKLTGLKRIQSTFRNRDYNSSDSYFPSGFDINSLLIGYMIGKYNSSSIESTISSHHHVEEPAPTYHSSSSSSSWGGSSGGSSWGGSSGGSSFGSGGGFGGGGFSSGKGF